MSQANILLVWYWTHCNSSLCLQFKIGWILAVYIDLNACNIFKLLLLEFVVGEKRDVLERKQ